MASISIKNLTKNFTSDGVKKNVLDNIDIEIKDGSFSILLGPSGCGKSTLLRLIAGLEKPDCGQIFIGEKMVNDVSPKDRNIAFVFQNYALYPHLTVYDNIAFPLKIRKFKKNEIEKRVKNATEILGLGELLKRKPRELSGGQRQRVALGRAIVREAKVFLLDEPLSNLDAKLRASMRIEIKKLQRQLKTTFIYVTHDQTEALTMGDEIIILNEGKIFQKGSPDEIFKTPKNTFAATFSGTYPMNLLTCTIKDNRVCANGLDFEIPNKYKKLQNYDKVIAGIRPENIMPFEIEGSFKKNFKIDFVENTGAIKILHFENDIKAVVNSKENFNLQGEFYINPNDFIFFDICTKNLIEAD